LPRRLNDGGPLPPIAQGKQEKFAPGLLNVRFWFEVKKKHPYQPASH